MAASLQAKRRAIRKYTRIIAGSIGFVYGMLYFFPSLRQSDYWLSRHLLLLLAVLIVWWGKWRDKQLVALDRKKKRDTLSLN